MSEHCENCNCGVVSEVVKKEFTRMLEDLKDEFFLVCQKMTAYNAHRTEMEGHLRDLVNMAQYLDKHVESDVSFIHQLAHRMDNFPELPLQLHKCQDNTVIAVEPGTVHGWTSHYAGVDKGSGPDYQATTFLYGDVIDIDKLK